MARPPFAFNYGMTLGGELIGFKVKVIADWGLKKKPQWAVGTTIGCDLFNWEVAKKKGVRRLYITEGEDDCVALQYMFDKACGGKYKYAVTSIPNGIDSAAPTIGRMYKEIRSIFDEVVLVFDNDEAGRKGVKDVQKVMPDIKEVPYPTDAKDANEALLAGDYAIFVDFALWKIRAPLIEGVMSVAAIVARGVPEPEIGLSYPWPQVNEVCLGQRWGEARCVGAGVGLGKTLICHEESAWNIIEHDEPVFVSLLEEENHKTLWNVCGKIDSLRYNIPDVFEANKEQYYETLKRIEGKLLVWNSQGNTTSRFDIDSILGAIRFNFMEYGCKIAHIDNITRLVDMMPTGEANEFINRYSSEIANLAAELGMNISLYSHLNPPRGKDSRGHEEGAKAYVSQLTGSRGIMRSFPNIWMFERNKDSEDTPNNSFINIAKNRDYGGECRIKTQWNETTGRLLENEWMGEELY